METLAFIIYTITGGPSEGLQFVTNDPVPCTLAQFEIDYAALTPHFHEDDIDVYCEYTSAPVTSMRPVARPTS